MRVTVADEVAAVRAIPDPLQRAQQAGQLLAEFSSASADLGAIRREAMETLTADGMTPAGLADALGVSRARVSQLMRSGPPPERALLAPDPGPVTVVVAGKVESDRPDPQPVVASDDLAAWETLADLARTLHLDISYEVLAPGEYLRLNRSNLVVMVGPRLAPNIREVLESDDCLSFARDERGWHLRDHVAGAVHRSPMDHGEPGDVAYLGRLPRPDGRGTILYLAGIHAAGEAGAAHWLAHHVADLYREVRTRRCSMLIGSTHDQTASPRRVVASDRLTPVYRPGGGAQ